MNPSEHDYYQNPLITRYSSEEMARIWGDQNRIESWRKLWIALASAEKKLGLPITDEQIEEMKANLSNIDFEIAKKEEKIRRHDVMAHVHTFGVACPSAAPIIHLGATSCFVTDNGDLMLLRNSIELIAKRLAAVICSLGDFATQHRETACLGFTHLQPAQPTTIGKRACLWNYDLILDLAELEHRLETLKARGTKGTTGTQASYLKLFDGDHEKVRQLDRLVSEEIGFESTYSVTGQTYPRKVDAQILDVLSGIAQSAHKMATDLRILSHRKEVDEPFGKKQIGSSAMAYKRNPMRSERICSLARFVISLQSSPANTLATQWMERTLDDSANRRLVLPQAFLAIDAILIILENVASGMIVHEKMIERHFAEELPFMATENLMMEAVAKGGNRQDLHEVVRVHSVDAANRIKTTGATDNDLLERLANDDSFADVDVKGLAASGLLDPKRYIGRSAEQVSQFCEEQVDPVRKKYAEQFAEKEELRV